MGPGAHCQCLLAFVLSVPSAGVEQCLDAEDDEEGVAAQFGASAQVPGELDAPAGQAGVSAAS
ncbi:MULTISPECIES: hypothetical protein [unclassified Streptomyces]|uniref:hypothetical protein n=1 Tax=unclassified Streptomyces TaxID=2593676 RepID=UPI002255B6A1|nr:MULTISPECIES: hypothetical protein [unclassified Streptomyces]MCX4461830.1 hypothetical protein [Streptomyces sp. NBC_01719]